MSEEPSNKNVGNPDEGVAEFLIGSRDNPDGTPAGQSAEFGRRLKRNAKAIERLAKVAGLTVVPYIEPVHIDTPPTERSKRIRQMANPKMADAALAMRVGLDTTKTTKPDGTTQTRRKLNLEFGAYANVAVALKTICQTICEPAKWFGRIAVRCGKWLKMDAEAGDGIADKTGKDSQK